MIAWGLLLICAAYLLGLASTGLRLDAGNATLPLASYGVLLLGLLGGIVMPQLWRLGPTRKQWFLAGMIGFIGAIYCVWRIPQPAADDISHFIPAHGNSFHSVLGTVVDIPQTTRSGKGKFWLQVRAVQDQAGQSVGAVGASRQDAGGKLYVTAPLGQVAGLYPGQWVQVSGKLYEPSPAEAPGEFDFRDYLARQGCFAGLSAKLVEAIPSQPSCANGL
jgi:competence protein ComEC